jgi:hypothetical protein
LRTTGSKQRELGLNIPFNVVTNPGSIHKCKQRHFGASYIEEGLLDGFESVHNYSPTGCDDSEEENYDSDNTMTYLERENRRDIRAKLLLLEQDTEYEPLELGLQANDT